MYFRKLILDGKARWYLFVGDRHLPAHMSVKIPTSLNSLECQARSRFFLYPSEDVLLKVRMDKYSPRNPVRWIGRILSDRLFLQSNPRKEYRGNRLYRKAGLKPVGGVGWGVALNPLNRMGSVYVMDYLGTAVNGRQFFDQADQKMRLSLIEQVCSGVVALARIGYINQDQHLGNIMVTEKGDLLWIDTHTTRLPANFGKRRRTLIAKTTHKLRHQTEYKEYARSTLERLLEPPQLGGSL